MCVFANIYTELNIPEYPKFLYAQKRYDESRESLKRVNAFKTCETSDSEWPFWFYVWYRKWINLVKKDKSYKIAQPRAYSRGKWFSNHLSCQKQPLPKFFPSKKHWPNLVRITVMWTICSFCSYVSPLIPSKINRGWFIHKSLLRAHFWPNRIHFWCHDLNHIW